MDVVRNNEVMLEHEHGDEQPSNVLMSHASDTSIFNKTEVLAGGWSCLPLTPPLLHLTPPIIPLTPPLLL